MKKLSLCLLFVLLSLLTYAQSEHGYTIEGEGKKGKERNTDWMENFYIGGGLGGLSFSSVSTSVGVSALAGYRWTDRLNSGVGLSYYYYDRKDFNYNYHVISPQFLTQYQVYGPVFAMGLYEHNIIKFNSESFHSDGLFFGGGYNQPIGGNAVINLFVMYNVLYDELNTEDAYSSPFYYGMNIMVGF